jgi:hypothetical protein
MKTLTDMPKTVGDGELGLVVAMSKLLVRARIYNV